MGVFPSLCYDKNMDSCYNMDVKQGFLRETLRSAQARGEKDVGTYSRPSSHCPDRALVYFRDRIVATFPASRREYELVPKNRYMVVLGQTPPSGCCSSPCERSYRRVHPKFQIFLRKALSALASQLLIFHFRSCRRVLIGPLSIVS